MSHLTQASLPNAFAKAAAKFGVSESDYLVLTSMGIATHESFYLRVHSQDDLEDFLKEVVTLKAGYDYGGDRGVVIFERTPRVPWQEFKRSEDAGALRKLWSLGRELAKNELEKLAEGGDSSKVKVGVAASVAMESAAVERGMPRPTSDSERPSHFALTKVARSLVGPGSSFEYIPWEVFLTLDEERRMERAGTLPKQRGEVVLGKDDKLAVKDGKENAIPGDPVNDMEVLRRRLDIRARSMEMLEACSYAMYRALHDRYFGLLIGEVPDGMRPPTINEVRRFDRTVHEEILRWLARDVGTLSDAINHYLSLGSEGLWKLLEPVIKSLPDQGVDKNMKRGKAEAAGGRDERSPLSRKRAKTAVPEPKEPPTKKQCIVCKKKHWPLCEIPAGFRRRMREEGRAKKGEAKAKAASASASKKDETREWNRGLSTDLANLPRKRPLVNADRVTSQKKSKPWNSFDVSTFSGMEKEGVENALTESPRSPPLKGGVKGVVSSNCGSFVAGHDSLVFAGDVASQCLGDSLGRVSQSVFEPWDLLRGKCVFKQRGELISVLDSARLRHFAPNCSTFSRAREIPIPNVRNAPKPLRNEECPEGIPSELADLSSKSRKKVCDDTEMANLSAEQSLKSHSRGDKFTLEHPRRSLAQHLPSWKKLLNAKGVFLTPYHTCMYEGSRRKKNQMLIHNDERFRSLGRICEGGKLCDRTGLPHLKWRPTTSGGKVVQFVTGEEREYPIGFCQEYASVATEILREGGKFVEVFSGPNAPLSQAICRSLGEVLPGSRLNTDRGVRSELRRLSQVLVEEGQTPLPSRAISQAPKPEHKASRVNMLEAGRQPSYGKRIQLIPDGLNSVFDHLQMATRLEHPFNGTLSLKEDHVEALMAQGNVESQSNISKLRTLAEWRTLSRSEEVVSLQKVHESEAGTNAKRLGRKPRTGLMQVLGSRHGVEDMAVPTLLLKGMPIIGPALESPFFTEYHVPAQITVLELLATAKKRRAETVRRVEYMASKGSQELAVAIHSKTMKEVQKGSMGGPFSESQLMAKHGEYYNLIPAFGLEQGVDEHGNPKYRRIDDHTAGHTNLAAERRQKIEMAMADYLVAMIKALHHRYKGAVVLGSEDMQGAYRQVPLVDSQVAVSITAVWDPHTKEVRFFELYGQPFGAAHAVPNFYRVAEFMSVLLTRAYSILVDHFFDDYFYVERPGSAKVSMFCLQQSFQLVGLSLDPDKSQPPAEVAHILGVQFNTASLKQERILLVEPKPTRKTNFSLLINQVLQKGILAPSVAASIVGKFGFLCSTLFGKVGRFCTGFVRERQYTSSTDYSFTPQLVLSLKLMTRIVHVAPHRTCSMTRCPAPNLLYTDASDVPHRDPRYGLGGVLIIQEPCFRIEYFSTSVDQSLVDTWVQKSTYMGQLELLAGPVALRTWKHVLQRQQTIHFVDNDSAASGLVKGYSPRIDSSPIIGDYWLLAAEYGMDIYIDRVESKSNLSDGPSRFDHTEMVELSAKGVQAVMPPASVSPFLVFRDSALHTRLCSLEDTITT